MTSPLDGFRVLDLTRVLAGPFATMRLGDMGAEVIKIEIPGQGDDTRSVGPPFVNGESSYFLSINRNKKSMTLNLRTEKGKEVLTKLIEMSDVVMENFRPGTLERLGFGYDRIQEINPMAIYCAISGFGHTGPRSTDPAYDIIIQAESGLMDVTGDPDGPPTKVGISITDVVAALAAVEGVLLALLRRAKTNRGQKVDISMLESILALFTFQTQRYFSDGQPPERMGNLHPTNTPYEPFAAKDDYFIPAIPSNALYQAFLQAIQSLATSKEAPLVKKLGDDRFSTTVSRVEHRAELRAILDELFRLRPADEWLEALKKAGVPCCKVNRVSEILESEVLRARDMVPEIDHPVAGRIRMVGIPVKLSDSPGEVRLPPPLLGQHTEEVLTGLGYSPDDILQMRTEEVV